MEFSKKLMFFSWSVTLVLTTLAIWFSVKMISVEAMNIIMGLSWAVTDTATGFYFWKAKNENRAKYAHKFLKDFTKEWDSETAIRMAEIVLKD